jgi:hypothetical protein
MPYRVETKKSGLELWSTNRQGEDFRVSDNPVDKIHHYKDRINNLYAPIIGEKCEEGDNNYFAVVTTGIIFTKEPTDRVRNLLDPLLAKKSSEASIIGIDILQNRQTEIVLPASRWRTSKLMTPKIAEQLRRWLVEPDFARTQREPLDLNPKQRNLSETRTESGYRRIRGAAGSGKSLVLAARAANLSAQGKNILIVSFNITLWHYLKDLVVRHKVPGSKPNTITYAHFHEWCKDIIVDGGYQNEYNKLFQNVTKEQLSEALEVKVVDIVNEAIDNIKTNIQNGEIFSEKYDAILVDEGQDFNLYWWNTLRRLLKEDGEMLLVADESQDLYERAKHWTEEAMRNAGFRGGPWNQLDVCYRIPDKLIDYLRGFAKNFLPESNIKLINAEPGKLDLWPAQLNWIQVTSEQSLPEVCVQSTLDIPDVLNSDTIAYPDLILLMPNHSLGMRSVNVMKEKGVDALHIFSLDKKEQKAKKMNFFMGDAHIKACTIHSFKGWEARYMVIAITKDTDLSAVYVAISRLKRNTKGSYLTVVCSNPNLRDFGMTWPNFSEDPQKPQKEPKSSIDIPF